MNIFDDYMTPLDRYEEEVQNNCKKSTAPSISSEMFEDITPKRPLAMVYSPLQKWENIYEPSEALEKGTLFADLYFPWLAGEKGGR